MNGLKQTLSGWGMYPSTQTLASRPERLKDLNDLNSPCLPRGYGRCYGDAAQLTDGRVILMERLNRFLEFDRETGVLRAEAGLSFAELLDIVVPHGWFPPVTPGTKWISLGGAVAADIHGKNHHVDSSIGRHIIALELIVANGTRMRCSSTEEPKLFWATVGGMGLTGVIAEVTLQLQAISSAYIAVKNKPARCLDEMFDYFADSSEDDKYSVAWIDCLAKGAEAGRGILMNGHHALPNELPPKCSHPFRIKKAAPENAPKWASIFLSSATVRCFNSLYFWANSRNLRSQIIDYDRYFYPLDGVNHWNRLYGKKGFVQYQFVVPLHNGRAVCKQILSELSKAQHYPYLAVLKRFGEQGNGLLSFPKSGYTLALDLPIKDATLFPLLDRLDALLLENEGRLYLAKDARMAATTFKAMYPRLEEWRTIKQKIDPENQFCSDLSKRLQI